MDPTPYYILIDRQPVPEPDFSRWAQWWSEIEHRRVAMTPLCDGALTVYTTFLGVDHGLEGNGPPVLFETMVHDTLKNAWWDEQWRYSDWDTAQAGHERACAFVMETLQHA